jgi:hypothetical protein
MVELIWLAQNVKSQNHDLLILLFFIGYFIYLHIPFSGFCSANPLLHPPPPASLSVLPHPPTHSYFTALAFPYTGALSLHRINGLSSHWCLTKPSFATHAAGARVPPCVLFGWWFSSWELWRIWLVDIVLPMGFQTPSVLALTPPLGSLCSVQWLNASIRICICQALAKNLTRQSYIGLLSASTSWHTQECLGFVSVYGMDPYVGKSLDGPSFTCFPLIFFRQKQIWVKHLEMSTWPHPSTGDLAWPLDMFLTGSPYPLLSISTNVIPCWVLGAYCFSGIWDLLVATPSSPSPIATYLCSISWPSV